MNVYFISGMGADSRVFEHISLPRGFEKVCIEWITPIKNESLRDYSLRLSGSIDKSKPFILVGLSMGGMMAVEIAKKYNPVLTILISSAQTNKQLGPFFRIVKRTHIYKIIPVSLLKSLSILKRYFTREDKETKAILSKVIRSSDNNFIRWAIPAVLKWDNTDRVEPLLHIHGTKDEILSARNAKATHWIPGGTHMMVMVRAKEINAIIMNVLNQGLNIGQGLPH